MSGDYSEIEVKLAVDDLEAVANRLESLGAALAKPRVYERNVRYDDSDRTMDRDGTVLRLREDNRIRLTYKAPLDPAAVARGVHERFEVEVVVDSFDAMETLLSRLGYHPYMVYEKYRTTYVLEGAEVVLDEMPYGTFVEIEGDEATINLLLEKLNLQDVPRLPYSYSTIFDHVRAHLGMAINDLTFANFEGVTVHRDAFLPPR